MIARCVEICFGTCDRTRVVSRALIWTALTAVIIWQGYAISQTQTKAREASERMFRIVHGSPSAIVMCDENSKITEFNREAEDMFGWKRSEALGQSVDVLIVQKDRKRHSAAFAKSLEHLNAAENDWTVSRSGMYGTGLSKDGMEIPIMFSTRGIKYGNRVEFLSFMRHATAVPAVKEGPLDLSKPR